MSSLWQEARNPADGRIYYYNVQTKETQWSKPIELMTPAERALQNTPWKEYTADGGRKYWYNTETKQSVWEMPDVLKQALSRESQGQSIQSFVAGGLGSSTYVQDDNIRQLAAAVYSGDALDSVSKHVTVASTGGDKDEPQYSNQDEAEAAFIKLLRRSGVQADWTWEQTMRAVIRESQYRALKDPKDRKAAFEKFTVELRMQELEKAKDRLTKLRQDFAVMLKSHPEIKYYTRWNTARPIIEGETIFRSAADNSERRQLFEEYVAQLRKAEQEREAVARKNAIEDLTNILKSLNLEPYTRWSEAQVIIYQNERIKSEEKFQVLSKLDVLNVFESHIKNLERAFNDQKQRAKSLKMRKERKNREAFVELLNSLRNDGHIRPGTKWMHIYPLIQDNARYISMLGQSGSTPLDLFWDMMEEVDREIRLKKNVTLDVLDERHFEITQKTALEEFISILQADSRTASFDRDIVVVLFDKLREKIVKRVEDDKHQAERQQRRRMDALRSAMKHLEPPVEVTATWEQVRPRIQKFEEYHALESDELRRQAFDKFIRRLKEKQEDKEKEAERRERKDREKKKEEEKLSRDRDRDRERDRERDRHRERDRESDLGRNGHSYHGRNSRHSRELGHGRSRSPEADPYEAERRRAAGERERQYHRGLRQRSSSRHRDRHERASSRTSNGASHYERERREREEERERQYRARGVDDFERSVMGRRRTRGISVESDDTRRDPKRTRRERTPHTPRDIAGTTPRLEGGKPDKIEEKGEESEEGEIAE